MPDSIEAHELPAWFPSILKNATRTVELNRNEKLFELNARSDAIYFVQAGEVCATRFLPDGTPAVMQRSRAGEFFAEAALCVERYTCEAVAAKKSSVRLIPKDRLTKLLQEDADLSLHYIRAISADMRKQCSRVERLRIKRAPDRVLHYLMCETDATRTLTLQTTRAQWADELGLEPETLYRTLAGLEQEGLIKRTDNQVTLLQS